MLSRNHPIVLFIDRNGFSVYQDVLTAIVKFNFTPDLVANLDVVDENKLTNLIVTFIQINKIVSSNFVVILSDSTIYTKDLTNPVQKPVLKQNLKTDSNGEKEEKSEVQNFLENIPFEEVLAKVIKAGGINRIVTVNKGLVMAIANAFASRGSAVQAIVPGFIYGQNVNFAMGLTSENVKAILENTEILRLGNLLTDQEKVISPKNSENGIKSFPVDGKEKPRNIRQYILIGAFIVLLFVLGAVYLLVGASQTPTKSPKIKNASASVTNVPIISPSPTLIPSPITAEPFDLKNVKMKIINSTQSDTTISTLKNELAQIGFENIAIETSEEIAAEKSSILFSQDIPVDIRDIVIVEIRKNFPDTSVLENQDVDSAITIFIGKS